MWSRAKTLLQMAMLLALQVNWRVLGLGAGSMAKSVTCIRSNALPIAPLMRRQSMGRALEMMTRGLVTLPRGEQSSWTIHQYADVRTLPLSGHFCPRAKYALL